MAQHRLIIDTLLQSYGQSGQPVVIIGHSMGGLLTLLTTLDKQWPVTKIIVIEPVAFSVLESTEDKVAQAEDLEKVLALDAALKGDGDPEQALAEFIAYWNGVAWQDLPEPMQEALLNQVEQIGADTLAVARDSTPPMRYRSMDLPVVLLQGTLTPAPARLVIQRLGQLLPDVKNRFVEGAGHMGPVQQPLLYAPLINDFLV